jgi:hypothetical protein
VCMCYTHVIHTYLGHVCITFLFSTLLCVYVFYICNTYIPREQGKEGRL